MSNLIITPDPGSPTTQTSAEPRFPRLADFLLNPDIAWRVGPNYAATPHFVERFAQNVRERLQNPRCAIIDANDAAQFLDLQLDEEWDLTRDIPQAKPIADMALWQWSHRTTPFHSGVLCKGVIQQNIDSAISNFEASQKIAFDYDVEVLLRSAHNAVCHMNKEDLSLPVLFSVGSVFEICSAPVKRDPLKSSVGKQREAVEFQVWPVGTFALTMNASGRPVPDSLVELTWDDTGDAAFERETMLAHLRAATQKVLLLHTLFRALETRLEPAPAHEVEGGGPFAGRTLAGFQTLDLRTLPKKLNEEAFAAKDGLKTAISYMPGKWRTPPFEWPRG